MNSKSDRQYPKCTTWGFGSSSVEKDATRMRIKDPSMYNKLKTLAKDAMLDPTWFVGCGREPRNGSKGLGKPERLTENLSGKYSRRYSEGDRLVYNVVNNVFMIYNIKGHYESTSSAIEDPFAFMDEIFGEEALLSDPLEEIK